MRIARVQLIVAAILFVGWLGYLAYLALGHSQPVVVSRTQLMNATSFPTLPDISGSWVVAEVDVDESGKPRKNDPHQTNRFRRPDRRGIGHCFQSSGSPNTAQQTGFQQGSLPPALVQKEGVPALLDRLDTLGRRSRAGAFDLSVDSRDRGAAKAVGSGKPIAGSPGPNWFGCSGKDQ